MDILESSDKEALTFAGILLLTTILLGLFIFTAIKLSNLMISANIQIEEIYNG
jgi:hypothetical protein